MFPCCLSGHLCPWSAGDAQWAGLEFQRLRGSPCSLLGPFTGQPNSPPARPSGPVSSAGISQGDLEVMPGEAWRGHVEHRPVTQLLWRSPQDRLVRPLWLHCQHCGCVVPLIGATVAPGCARRVGLSARAHLGLPGPSATSLLPFWWPGHLGDPTSSTAQLPGDFVAVAATSWRSGLSSSKLSLGHRVKSGRRAFVRWGWGERHDSSPRCCAEVCFMWLLLLQVSSLVNCHVGAPVMPARGRAMTVPSLVGGLPALQESLPRPCPPQAAADLR